MGIKVLVSDKISKKGLESLFNHSHFEVTWQPGLPVEELKKNIKNYQVLLVRSATKVTAEVLEEATNLKFIGRAGAGVDNIDLTAASRKGVLVANVPGGNTIAATEHAFALLLALVRNIPQANNSLCQGKWERSKFVGTELYGKTLSLLGLGRIGSALAKRARSFGLRVVACDPFVTQQYAKQLGVELVNLEEALKEGDFISLHLPANEQTRNLINRQTIGKMKDGVRIINCARGEIVDEQALVEALDSGKVAGAALDVFSEEPLPKDSLLLKERRDNLILTPHLGASTTEAQERVAQEIAQTVIDYFEKGVIRNVVNLPSFEPREILLPYLDLAEKLAGFLVQVLKGAPQEFKIECLGEIATYNITPFTLAALKGYFSFLLGSEVNLVNSGIIARERGVKVKETKMEEIADFANLISLEVTTTEEKMRIGGTLLSRNLPRIVQIDDLNVDITPQGWMLFLINEDRPGIIGYLGTLLGKNNINIGNMEVGRKEKEKEAVTVINIDSPVEKELLEEIATFSGIKRVNLIKL